MKRTICRWMAGLLVFLAAPAVLLMFAFCLPPQYDDVFLGELKYKCDALEEAPGRRIVVVGGSGVAFGQISALLEEELPGWSVVNFGMYAGLGSTVTPELARARLREGDVVIFSPEQSGQTLSLYLNPEAMWQASDGRPELLRAVDRADWGAMAAAFPAYAGAKARLFGSGTPPEGDGVYRRSAFNRWGDIDAPERAGNVMTGGWDRNMPVRFASDLPSEEFLDYVNQWAAECRARGVRFYYRFCPVNALAVSEGELAGLDRYERWLKGRLDCDFLGTARDCIMDGAWFYDTNFHLNSAGAVMNTAALAAQLKAALGYDGPVGISIPDQPEFAQADLTGGDDTDGACFVYENVGGELRLTGLTREGQGRTSLTVPAQYGGLPVTAFSQAVFAGNTAVREIVLQENIKAIQDGSFSGCTALERLVIRSASPSACLVGTGLLDGTDAWVYVPADRLGAYATDYFWAAYAARLRAAEGSIQSTPCGPAGAEEARPAGPAGPVIHYEGNGGTLRTGDGVRLDRPMNQAHLRVNTAPGTRYFVREGYALIGWNTEPGGDGAAVGLGSRTERVQELTLYAQWAEESAEEDFEYRVEGNQASVTRYVGTGGRCVVPETLGGTPVKRICAGAFQSADLDTLVLPLHLSVLEPGALRSCTIRTLYVYDSLREISDGSFENCTGPTTLRINAATSPVYSGSYYDTFADKYDRLLSLRGEGKLVLFSGSSGRYGYNSPMLEAAFPMFRVVNMGVYAYTNALPQLELIRELMEEGDVLLSAPEFDAAQMQFCAVNRLDAHFWAMMEANYDAAARLDLGAYSGVFDSLGAYLTTRSGMVGRDYGVSSWHYDDDGNYYAFSTYNEYGDLILPRPNGERDERLRHNIADYTVDSFPAEYLEGLNKVYREFLEEGIAVYFTYTPRNRWSLTQASTPQSRQALHEYLTGGLCVPVISEIEESLYPGVYFYLIDSHLSSEGADIRTQRVISDLQKVMLGATD